jgi:hypothetical protein
VYIPLKAVLAYPSINNILELRKYDIQLGKLGTDKYTHMCMHTCTCVLHRAPMHRNVLVLTTISYSKYIVQFYRLGNYLVLYTKLNGNVTTAGYESSSDSKAKLWLLRHPFHCEGFLFHLFQYTLA